MNSGIILRYHEISLKGGKRGWFEHQLAQNALHLIRRNSPEIENPKYRLENGRILLQCEATVPTQKALGNLFGLANYSPVYRFKTNLETLSQIVIEKLQEALNSEMLEPQSFRIQTKRIEKTTQETSTELNQVIGAAVLKHFPHWKVKLKGADLVIGIEICKNETSLWFEKKEGLRGLPVGCTGHVLTLISGGIDSPIAALQMLKRGAQTSFVHFFGTPFVGEETLLKVEDLARQVNRYQPHPKPLYVVPFGKIQERVAQKVNPRVRTLIYRRLMLAIASELAKKVDALALVTGESLAQVASQTLQNLSTIGSAASLPVLRPLLTFDKFEIIDLAKKWETYPISIRPGIDCCTLFADRHPVLNSDMETLEKIEKKLSISELVQEGLSLVTKKRLL